MAGWARSGCSESGRHGGRRSSAGATGLRIGVTAALVVSLTTVGAPSASAADPLITGIVTSGPVAAPFGKVVQFSGTITNGGQHPEDSFSSVVIENDPVNPSTGLAVSTTSLGPVAPEATVPFSVSARVLGAPGTSTQLRLKATGTATGVSPTTTFLGSSAPVTDAVVLSVAAARQQAGAGGFSDCPDPCAVSIHDSLRYTVTAQNVSDIAISDLRFSVPAPPGTTTTGAPVPATSFALLAAGSPSGADRQSVVLEVAVNDPPGEPQPGAVLTLIASATYDATSASGQGDPGTTLDDEAATPSMFVASVVDPLLAVVNAIGDTNGDRLVSGDQVDSLVTIDNTGNRDATGTVLTVDLTNLRNPTNVVIPGANGGLPMSGPHPQITKTTDQLVVRIGTGANSSTGGTVAPSDGPVEIRFVATVVDDPAGSPAEASSLATVTFGGGGVSPKTATAALPIEPAAPHLTLVKQVINDDGGTAAATAFTLTATADGLDPLSGAGGADGDVAPGTYALSESGPGGYSASDWVCTGTGTQSGASIALAAGQRATCTITNDDIRRVSDIGVALGSSSGRVKSGDTLTYTAIVTNDGPQGSPVTLVDHLPSGVSFRSVSGASCGAPPPDDFAGALICDVGEVASGQTKVVTITVLVGKSKKTTVTNSVEVAPAGGATDPVSANNVATVVTQVK